MDQRIKKLWVDALRSGEYQQGKSFLRHHDRFCCLGVLCDLYQKETNLGKWKVVHYEDDDGQATVYQFIIKAYPPETATLPWKVMKWAGLEHRNPVIAPNGLFDRSAVRYNDKGYSFKEIAQLIEDNL